MKPHPPHLSSMPMLLPAIALASGILAGYYLPWWLCVAAALSAAICFIFRHTVAGVTMTVMTTGICLSLFTLEQPPSADFPAELASSYYRGQVVRVSDNAGGYSARIAVTAAGAGPGSLKECRRTMVNLSLRQFEPQLRRYDNVVFNARLRKTVSRHDIPYEIDPADHLLDAHIFYMAVADSADFCSVTSPGGLRGWLMSLADRSADLIYESSLTPSAKSFLAATLIGDTSMLDADRRQTFARAGLAHILALSGLHIGIIALILSIALSPVLLVRGRLIMQITILALLWAYAVAVGLPPSVVRAVTMASVYYLGLLLCRSGNSFNSLAFAAFIILLFDPASLFSKGFQLSFAAVASILMFARPLCFVSHRHRWLYLLNSYAACSMAAMLGTGLLSACYFHTFPVYFLIANLMASFLLPWILGGGMLIVMLAACGVETRLLCTVVSSLCDAINVTSEWLTSLPGAFIDSIYMPTWTAVVMAAAIILAWIAITYRKRLPALLALSITLAGIVIMILTPHAAAERKIYFGHSLQHTDIYISRPECKSMTMLTTAVAADMPQLRQSVNERLERYLAKTGTDSVNILRMKPDEFIKVSCGQKKLIVVTSRDSIPAGAPQHCDYMVLAAHCHQPLAELARALNPDTLIISADTRPSVMRRRLDEATALGLPAIAIRTTPFSISY